MVFGPLVDADVDADALAVWAATAAVAVDVVVVAVEVSEGNLVLGQGIPTSPRMVVHLDDSPEMVLLEVLELFWFGWRTVTFRSRSQK